MSLPDTPKLNILVAYPYFTDGLFALLKDHADTVRLLVDSGAFTAYRKGTTIKCGDYCRFLQDMPVKPWRYFMLDVIGDPVATSNNYKAMMSEGLSPIPIFTRGEDPAKLDEYYETSDVVGIGGLVRTQRNRAFVNGIMRKVGDRKVHLLGFTDIPFLKLYKPYSCDSSGWNQVSFGQLRLYMGSGRFKYVRQQDMIEGPPPPAIIDRLRGYGIDVTALRHKSGWTGKDYLNRPAVLATFRGMVHAARDIETNLGTKFFFACGINDIRGVLAAWQEQRA